MSKFKVNKNTIYTWVLNHKLLTICVLFTIFTMLDTIPILLGLYPPKQGINTYIHLLGRLFLHSILVFGIYIFDLLKKRIKNGFVVYLSVFVLTWGMLLLYLLVNSLFVELHPDAFKDATRSYIGMYSIFGIIYILGIQWRKFFLKIKGSKN